MANERHTDQREWDIDYSTRQSVHAVTKYNPFREALSTTASTLFTPGQGEIATNWVQNPRIEATDISIFTASGSAISRSTAQQSVGAASLLVNPANSANHEGFYWESQKIPFSVNPQHISVQVEHRGASASGAVKIEVKDTTNTVQHAVSASSDLATSWTRITTTYTIPGATASAAYRLYVTTAGQHNINYYVDKIMFEVREDTAVASTYVDGSSGINYEWTGTANASSSVKKRGMTTIKGIKVTNESSTGGEIVYLAIGTTATSSTGIPIGASEAFETTIPLGFTDYISVISASGTPTIRGVIWGV